ncbi:thiopurine S-methyltransferase [Luteimonas sp. BDR2-5]|uniref:thiopurine S-methyltransferase n=1 Tax=Proluteimonas luteida TaxID=2878685 RepID=UPI001E5338C9|nr:thiopurine S-methyltransferase [Luteimonas sp. BDR2-5]MCD9028482.1 thiopurine S-methyltransferase [Luteimonas sp. BDR2-5]
MDAAFWHERWGSGRIGFHQDRPLPLLCKHWPALALASDARVFVPLCGKSLDMAWLAEQGHRVLGVELSELAIRQFFDERGLVPTCHDTAAGTHFVAGPFELIRGNAFALDAALLAGCAGIYDRAALIALPPALRATYAATAWHRMPAGCRGLLVTLAYPQHQKSGPPFSVDGEQVHALLDRDWRVDLLDTCDILEHEPGFVADGVTALSTGVWRVQRRG